MRWVPGASSCSRALHQGGKASEHRRSPAATLRSLVGHGDHRCEHTGAWQLLPAPSRGLGRVEEASGVVGIPGAFASSANTASMATSWVLHPEDTEAAGPQGRDMHTRTPTGPTGWGTKPRGPGTGAFSRLARTWLCLLKERHRRAPVSQNT